MLRGHQKKLAGKIEEEKNKALELQKKLEGVVVEFQKKITNSGKLFGAVTSLDISKELSKREISVERRLIRLERPIKALGVFKVNAHLFTSVNASFQVKVIQDLKQLEQTKKAAKKTVTKKAKTAIATETTTEKVVSTTATTTEKVVSTAAKTTKKALSTAAKTTKKALSTAAKTTKKVVSTKAKTSAKEKKAKTKKSDNKAKTKAKK